MLLGHVCERIVNSHREDHAGKMSEVVADFGSDPLARGVDHPRAGSRGRGIESRSAEIKVKKLSRYELRCPREQGGTFRALSRRPSAVVEAGWGWAIAVNRPRLRAILARVRRDGHRIHTEHRALDPVSDCHKGKDARDGSGWRQLAEAADPTDAGVAQSHPEGMGPGRRLRRHPDIHRQRRRIRPCAQQIQATPKRSRQPGTHR